MSEISRRYHRRNQFFLGPPEFAKLDGWCTLELGNRLVLCTHPDIQVNRVERKDCSLTLVGHLLDSRNPKNINAEILEKLFRSWHSKKLDDFPCLTDSYCGRWFMIAATGKEAILVTDATGQRQVHYAKYDDKLYCASQAKPLADALDLSRDPRAVEFLDTCRQQMGEHFTHQFWWPHDRTEYVGIKRLLPNHYLSLNDGVAHRFFGAQPIAARPLEDVVPSACELLRGAALAAGHRSRLILACTAGWDSRALMAASWPLRRSILYYTNRRWGWPDRHPDLAIPRKLLARHGLDHRIVTVRPEMSSEFSKIYNESYDVPHEAWAVKAEAELRQLPADAIILSGNVSEVCRCFFPEDHSGATVTPEFLAHSAAKKSALPVTSYTIAAFSDWLATLPPTEPRLLLDLFYWENRCGSWGAALNDEVGIAHDRILPFNCRELLEAMLSVDKTYRCPPTYELYRQIIETLLPGGLDEPVNPPMPPPTMKEKTAKQLEQTVHKLIPSRLKRALRDLNR